jgi:hypothetical protein
MAKKKVIGFCAAYARSPQALLGQYHPIEEPLAEISCLRFEERNFFQKIGLDSEDW